MGDILNCYSQYIETVMEIICFICGLIVYLIIAGIVTGAFLDAIRRECEEKEDLLVKAWILGGIERVFFMLCTAFDLSGLVIGMMAWITIKSVVSQQVLLKQHNYLSIMRGDKKNNSSFQRRKLALSSIVGSLISMLFALVGGLIIRYWIFTEFLMGKDILFFLS